MGSPRVIMKPIVSSIHMELGSVCCIELKHPHKPHLPPFESRSHVDLYLPDRKIRRYSLCADPTNLGRHTIAVKREETGRGGSVWIQDNIAIGAELAVSAPRNHFRLAESDGSDPLRRRPIL